MASNQKYVLRYFDFRGRGEPVRWMLKATGADYEEERIAIQDWQSKKPEFEWGTCPVLIVNGVQLHQTTVICKYLARQHNLAPEDAWESARLDEIAESVQDLTANMSKALVARIANETDKVLEFLQISHTQISGILPRIESTISKEGWIRSKEMTWVDIFVAAYVDQFERLFQGVLENTPKLQEMVNNVRKLPAIKSWIENRPPPNMCETRP